MRRFFFEHVDYGHGVTADYPRTWFIAATVALVVGAIALVGAAAAAKSCHATAERIGVESDFGFFTGCLYNFDGQWVPDELIRENDLLTGGSR